MLGKILIIEDDQQVNHLITERLTLAGYHVSSCLDGKNGQTLLRDNQFDLLLLDVLLPNIDGLSLLEQLRTFSQTPVIILSALATEQNRIKGFKYGADDYLTKPFSIDELLLRIEAILRRTSSNHALNPPAPTAMLEQLGLTAVEYQICSVLCKNLNQTLSKPYLYREALHKTYQTYDRTLDMHISKIRKKLLEHAESSFQIKTVHGQGYRLTDA